MKNSFFAACAAGALLFGTTGAHAQFFQQPSFYGELGYTSLSVSDGTVKARPSLVRLLVGANLNPYLAVEGLLGTGVQGDDSTSQGANVHIKVTNAYGFFFKPQYTLTPNLQVYGRWGWVHPDVKVTTSMGTFSAVSDTSYRDVAYGLGAAYQFTPRWAASLDYLRYFRKDGATARGLTAGVRINF